MQIEYFLHGVAAIELRDQVLALLFVLIIVLLAKAVQVALEAGAAVRIEIVEHQVLLLLLAEAEVARLGEFGVVLVTTGQRLYLVTVHKRLFLADVLLVDCG